MEKFFDEKRRIKINNSCSRVKERERDPYRPSILCTLFANDKQTEDQRQRVKIFINRVTTIILYIYNIRLEYQFRVNEAHTHREREKILSLTVIMPTQTNKLFRNAFRNCNREITGGFFSRDAFALISPFAGPLIQSSF